MARLLVIHVLHQRTQMRMGARDGRDLESVDQGRGELTGMVDTELEFLNQLQVRLWGLCDREAYSTVKELMLFFGQRLRACLRRSLLFRLRQ